MEKIVASAIKFLGVVYTGKRHHNCIRTIIDTTGVKKVGSEHPQGFITESGIFLNRVDAAKLALASGQITKLKFNSKELFSEDLW